jgi:hypothetical protein
MSNFASGLTVTNDRTAVAIGPKLYTPFEPDLCNQLTMEGRVEQRRWSICG